MRTTVRIDDDLLRELKRRAERNKTSLNKFLNGVIRNGLSSPGRPRPRYREKTFAMGKPLVNLDKALSLAAQWEDDRIMSKSSHDR